MKRLKGICKGCKCALKKENGEYQCMSMANGKRLKKAPKTCEKSVDVQNETAEAIAAKWSEVKLPE